MPATRQMRILTLFAILFASVWLAGGHAAIAIPPAMTGMDHAQADAVMAGHCTEMHGEDEHRAGRSIDCMIACAGLPAIGATLAAPRFVAAPRPPLPLQSPIFGMPPEMELPPPRFL